MPERQGKIIAIVDYNCHSKRIEVALYIISLVIYINLGCMLLCHFATVHILNMVRYFVGLLHFGVSFRNR